MQFKDEDGALMGVALKDSTGTLVWVGFTNQKGYRKSLENSRLWVLDGTTGRLLPLEDLKPGLAGLAGLSGISLEDSQVLAVSNAARDSSQNNQARVTRANDALPQGTQATGMAAHVAGMDSLTEKTGTQPALDFAVLADLEVLIRRRKAELPEGSYTTHLFKAGIDKIRKKTGEEAVELILAKEKPEVISETADLIYHLLVLLAQWEIPLEDILAELKKR